MWTADKTSVLIDQWQSQPSLYDIENPDYNNKVRRDESLEVIRRVMEQLIPGVTVMDIKNKIRGLRTQYARERMQMKFALKNGNPNYKPKLWCFGALSFLKESGSHVKTFMKKQCMGKVYLPVGQRPVCVMKQDKSTPSIGAIKNSMCLPNPSLAGQKSQTQLNDDYFAKCISYELGKIQDEDILSDTKLKIFEMITDAVKQDRDIRRYPQSNQQSVSVLDSLCRF